MAVFARLAALALAFAGICAALEKHDLKALDEQYDYIVVGGGVSGLVVANRLTEDSKSGYQERDLLEVNNTDLNCRDCSCHRIRRTSEVAKHFCAWLRGFERSVRAELGVSFGASDAPCKPLCCLASR